MTDETPLPDDRISQFIRDLPDVWEEGQTPASTKQIDTLVTSIVHSDRMRGATWSTRRRRLGAVSLAVVGTIGAATGVAAWIRSAQPSRPNEGVACHATAAIDGDVILVDLSNDPVASCRAAWKAGAVPGAPASGPVPNLVACVGPAGAAEVFPGDDDICGQLGLPAFEGPNAANQQVIKLNKRIIAEVNAQPCATTAVAKDRVQRILDEEGLHDWTLALRPGWENATCAKAAVDSPSRTVMLFGL